MILEYDLDFMCTFPHNVIQYTKLMKYTHEVKARCKMIAPSSVSKGLLLVLYEDRLPRIPLSVNIVTQSCWSKISATVFYIVYIFSLYICLNNSQNENLLCEIHYIILTMVGPRSGLKLPALPASWAIQWKQEHLTFCTKEFTRSVSQICLATKK